jgi:hypothetical protein
MTAKADRGALVDGAAADVGSSSLRGAAPGAASLAIDALARAAGPSCDQERSSRDACPPALLLRARRSALSSRFTMTLEIAGTVP